MLHNTWFRQTKIQLLIIIILTFLAYSNIFSNGFVIDDPGFITNWQEKKDISNLQKILSGEGPVSKKDYRPVRDLIFVVYYQIFGTNPFGYHLHSILVHLGITVLVYFITRQLIQGLGFRGWGLGLEVKTKKNSTIPYTLPQRGKLRLYPIPFISALLFGLHPIHTEAITFITSSIDMTGVLFMFGSFYLYLKSQKYTPEVKKMQLHLPAGKAGPRGGGIGLYIGSLIAATLAFLTYDATIILPVLLVFTELYLEKPKVKLIAKRIIPYLIIIAAVFAIRVTLGRTFSGFVLSKYSLQGLYHVQLLMSKVDMLYIYLMVLPLQLSINHVIADGVESFSSVANDVRLFFKESMFESGVFLSILVIAALIFIAVKFFKNIPLISFSIGWFFISLLPFANFTPQFTPMAERYVYIASFGFCLLLGYLLVEISNFKFQISNYFLLTLFFLLLSLYFYLTYQRNKDWKDDITLWQKVIQVEPKSALAYGIVADYLMQKDYQQSIEYDAKAVALRPNFYQARYNLAYAYSKIGDYKQAEEQYKKVIEVNPNFSSAYINLANIYKIDRPELAVKLLLQAKLISPREDLPMIYRNLGLIYREQGKVAPAIESFKKALLLDSNDELSRQNIKELLK